MRDDLGITTRIENGKAYLEFTLPEKLREGDACGGRLRIVIREAGDGRQIFCGEYDPGELGADDGAAVAAASVEWDAGSVFI